MTGLSINLFLYTGALLVLATGLLSVSGSPADWLRALTLRDFNTRLVVLSTMMLGTSAGIVGSFTLLRKRALLGDALSHATLPGIYFAFLVSSSWGIPRALPVLLLGAVVSGLLGALAVSAIRGAGRIKEDTALGIVLSVFFGLGIAALGLIQQMEIGHAAGLEGFIYGKTASMVTGDAWLIGCTGLLCVLICLALFKELRLLCFDEEFAAVNGSSIRVLDLVLMGLVVGITVVGLQAVGAILIISLLVTPAAAARFWTDELERMVLLAGSFGALSGLVGSVASTALPDLPSGAMIVLVASALFGISWLFGHPHGVLWRSWNLWSVRRKVARQHLLRAMFEIAETKGILGDEPDRTPISLTELLAMRSWSQHELRVLIAHMEQEGWVLDGRDGTVRFTVTGQREAQRLVHQHRILELYLITHADVAPGRVDRDADAIEHYLDSDVIAQLESQLPPSPGAAHHETPLPSSPHPLFSEEKS